ncbi:MAG: hypothetical protein LC104_00240 [Bacteroidales bacterium]|nr:hypothetical protein [Bacteroidales bacterium]
MLRRLLFLGLAVGFVAESGCRHSCKKPLFGRSVTEPVGGFLGAPVAPPPGGGAMIPPPNVPTTPSAPPPSIPDSSGSLRLDPSYPPPDYPPPQAANRSMPPPATQEPPQAAPQPQPRNKVGPELLLPDPLPPKSSSAFGQPPASSPGLEDPLLPKNHQKAPSTVPLPSGTSDLPPSPMPSQPVPQARTDSSPIGLAGYTSVAENPGVFAGRRPTLDGFDWLKANGFRTVLFLHAPETDVTPARELAEKHGLQFESLAVTPAGLPAAVTTFRSTLANRVNRPLYVADEDGWRAGILWYLHFRTTDLLGDDAARLRARGLGLPSADSELGKEFWAAAQQYLANR